MTDAHTEGSTCVVTGAASGIGQAIARRLAAEGWHLVLVDLSEDALEATARELRDAGASVVTLSGDVSDRDIHRRAATLAGVGGRLTGWVNCAGVTRHQSIPELTEDEVTLVLGINQLGALWGSSAAVQAFLADGHGGQIVNISSIHGRGAAPGHAVYEMTKAAVDALTRNISTAHAAQGVRANSVAPGAVMTPALSRSLSTAHDSAAALAELERQAPIGRLADPSEIASVVAFLLSDDASYLTGQSIAVDGGWTTSLSPISTNSDARRS